MHEQAINIHSSSARSRGWGSVTVFLRKHITTCERVRTCCHSLDPPIFCAYAISSTRKNVKVHNVKKWQIIITFVYHRMSACTWRLSYVQVDKLFYTTYISVDHAHHEIFRAKYGKDGISWINPMIRSNIFRPFSPKYIVVMCCCFFYRMKREHVEFGTWNKQKRSENYPQY